MLGPAFAVVVADTIGAAEVARVAAEVVALRRHLKSLRRCHNWTWPDPSRLSCLRWCLRCRLWLDAAPECFRMQT